MANIFFFGDSIAFGAWDKEGGWVERIKKHVLQKMLSTKLEYYHQIYNLGIPGDSTATLLQRIENELSVRIERDQDEKQVIVFAIGINDSYMFVAEGRENVAFEDFQKNLLQLFEIAKKYTRDIIFVGLTPVDEELVHPVPWRPELAYTQELVKKYNDAVKEFCAKQNIPFVDMYTELVKEDFTKLLIDGLHPDTKGHEKMSHSIIKVLEEHGII